MPRRRPEGPWNWTPARVHPEDPGSHRSWVTSNTLTANVARQLRTWVSGHASCLPTCDRPEVRVRETQSTSRRRGTDRGAWEPASELDLLPTDECALPSRGPLVP